MIVDFKNVRIPWKSSPYPPYHEGPYIEEYFYDYYKNNKSIFDDTGYTLIPIFWTTAYLYRVDVQSYINYLPKNKRYFCVSQHDDSVKEILPVGTKVFSAGGNSGGIPIPLVCSPIRYKNENNKKDIFCSFVGSKTHTVRDKMVDALKNDSMFYIDCGEWSFNIEKHKETHFLDIISRSKFTLCPRGYGAQSFRFYEALQLGSVPIYIHDDNKWLPYSDILEWNTFAIVLHIKDIDTLKDILLSITEDELGNMIESGKRAYNNYFKMDNLPLRILNKLKQ
jgi:hypothetical protein